MLHKYIIYYILHPVGDEHSRSVFHGDTEEIEKLTFVVGPFLFISCFFYVANNLDRDVGNTVTAGTDCPRWSRWYPPPYRPQGFVNCSCKCTEVMRYVWCDSKEVAGRQTRRREKKRIVQIKMDGWCRIVFEEYWYKKMGNKIFGQNRIGIVCEGSQDRT
jgi:hypothetical protein